MNTRYWLFLLMLIAISACDQIALTGADYDACVLDHIRGVNSVVIVDTVKASCKQRYPKKFDFDRVAEEAGVKPWAQVASQSVFLSGSEDVRLEIQRQYFADVIEPHVHSDYVIDAERQFEQFAKRISRDRGMPRPE